MDGVEIMNVQSAPHSDEEEICSLDFSEGKAVVQDLVRVARNRTLALAITKSLFNHAHDDQKEYLKHFRILPSCDPRSGGPPYFTVTIFLACIWMHYVVHSNCQLEAEKCWSEVPLYLSSNAEENREETWRYLSYALLHLDFMHLMSNMLIFLPTGIILELVHGPVRIGAIFFMGIIFGALGHLAYQEGGSLIGASAGCYAILGTNIANVVKNGDVMKKSFFAVRVIFWGMVLVGVGYETYIGLTHEPENGVSWSAHFGGFWTGITFGFWSLSNFEVQTWERVLEVVASTSFWCSFIYNALRR
jgi:rhomboid-related protein 1/2/3